MGGRERKEVCGPKIYVSEIIDPSRRLLWSRSVGAVVSSCRELVHFTTAEIFSRDKAR